MASSKPISVVAGIAANLAVMITKFVAAAFTGSASMMAEGIHSLVDTANGGLMLLGTNLSQRPADEGHPFGHGKDLYFWTLIVATSIFSVGGGVTIVEGIERLIHPEEIEKPIWDYAVLGAAFVFE